jgi:chromosome segregation ATPase
MCCFFSKILQEEFQALKSQVGQLKIDYNRMKPACLELEQQLETAKRTHQRTEDELLFYKNKLADIHNHENERFNEKYVLELITKENTDFFLLGRFLKKFEPSRPSEPSIFLDDDTVIIASEANQDSLINTQ